MNVRQPPIALPANAECLGCRYPLVDVTQGVCPECGRVFDLRARASYGPRAPSGAMRWAISGPGWGTFISCGVVVVLSALAGSTPVAGIGWAMLGFLGGASVMLVCGLRLVTAAVGAMSDPGTRAAAWSSRRRWLAVVLIGVLCVGLLVVKPVWRVRWLLSRPALDAMAADVRAGRPFGGRGWRGLVHVESPVLNGVEVHAVFDVGGLGDTTTLIHSPNGPPTRRADRGPFSLGGGWYFIVDSF